MLNRTLKTEKYLTQRRFRKCGQNLFIVTALLPLLTISNNAFAARNTNISQACEQFKLSAAQPSAQQITFKYYAGSPEIYRTYYKDHESGYYLSPEDRANKRLRMTVRGDIVAHPLKEISREDYQKFFATCGIFADDTLLEFGSYLLTSQFDPVVAAKALENSEWFETANPLFITHIGSCCSN